ncbi:MAG: NAD(P)-dependent glycerol-3-phosphate dehydrogenase [Candidatus Omnitrophica bacterium]|nr:NAD(P)-dependent glycerol-3-phosphate dehydrogenase [Candidatus Omnitrophota bacterium]
MKISVLGDGGWGTALSILLSVKNEVCLWGVFPEYIDFLNKTRENKKFLPYVRIPDSITILSDLKIAVESAELLVLAIPAEFMRSTVKRLKKYSLSQKTIINVAKGIEQRSLMLMSAVIDEELSVADNLCVLSGPSHAEEVSRNIPTAVVAASLDKKISQKVQQVFSQQNFRVYTSSDIIGTQLGGSLKNVIAIAVGMCDGLSLGANTKAALITRGLVEMRRLGLKMGASFSTFAGLSGMGDLVATCFSNYSRNRKAGKEIGEGKKLKKILRETEMVIEGVNTVQAVVKLSQRHNIEMPISKEVYLVLFEDKEPQQAVRDLMLREMKEE